MTTAYTLETKDPTFAGVTQQAEIEKSWSRGLLKKVYLSPMNMMVILIHPWLASSDKGMQDAWRYREKYGAQTVVVGEIKEIKT